MTIKQIEERLEEGESLKTIAQAYSEIANLKIKRIRGAVLRNRLFFDEISKVYGMVKTFALKKKIATPKPKNRLCILLTSNYRFYGTINSSLINYFIGSVRQLPDVDKIILGQGGVDYFKVSKVLPKYQEMLLKDDMPTSLELGELAKISTQYNQVFVYFAKLKSLMVQQATFTDITTTSIFSRFQVSGIEKGGESDINFLFEPELPKILQFFETQILTLLLEQTFLESELSRTASRFISMDTAQTEANKFIKENLKLRSFAKRSLKNNKILENFAVSLAAKQYGQSI